MLGFRDPAWGGASWPSPSKPPAFAVSTALAEILSVKDISGRKLFYVHYIDCECWAGVRGAAG